MTFSIVFSEKDHREYVLVELAKIDDLVQYAYSLKIEDHYTIDLIYKLHGQLDHLKRLASQNLTDTLVDEYIKNKRRTK